MSRIANPSLEAYSFNIKSDIDKRLLKACDAMLRNYKQTGMVEQKHMDDLVAVLSTTGIKFGATMHTNPHPIMAIDVTQLRGHAGNKFWGQMAVYNEKLVGELFIDLENLKVSGDIIQIFPMTLHMSYGFLELVKDNVKSFVGILLHELGHPFNFFLGLGDYIWSNYMLTDGVDIIMGNKPNTRKIKILDHQSFVKLIPDAKGQQEFLNNRTEQGVRNVVLTNLRSLPRPHLFHGTNLEYRHDEQLADVLPTRMGYAKYVAEYLVALDRDFQIPDMMTNSSYWTMEVMKAAFFIPAIIPVGIIMAFMDFGGDDYDRQENRLRRMRQDIIAQLRQESSFTRKDQLVEDIDAIERLEKEYKTRSGVLGALLYFFNRKFRRSQQMSDHEKTLEGLLNNDMFTQAHKLAQLAK